MVITNCVQILFRFFGAILNLIFGLFPNVSIPTDWAIYARGLLDWCSYFFPIHVIRQQFSILVALLGFYLIFKTIRFIIRR